MKSFSICLVTLFAVLAGSPASAQKTIIVDNLEATFEGSWTNGAAASDKHGPDYRFAYCVDENAPAASAVFRPNMPSAGRYHVEISYPRGGNRSTNALWSISTGNGLQVARVNQQMNGGDWVRIASNVEFAAGTGSFVKLVNNTGEIQETAVGKPVVVADAVRFVGVKSEDTASAGTKTGAPIEVDDEQVELEGEWLDISYSAGKHGKRLNYTTTKESTTARATFRPTLPHAGKYDVEIWYVDGKNRASSTPWIIMGSDGETMAFVDQSENGGKWMRIASAKSFASGTTGYAQLQNGIGKTGSVVVADAVRFIPVDAGKPTPSPASVNPVSPSASFALNLETKGKGRIRKSPDQLRYPANATVTLTATAEEGYVFGGWTGDIERMMNPLTITMNSDKRFTANFWEAGIGVIMDNTDAEFEGKWAEPTGVWGNPRYDNYLFSPVAEGGATASATYQPNLPRNGLYDVYVWYAAGANRCSNSPWEIVHKRGTETIQVDQTANGGRWTLLASGKEFESGKKGHVRLSNKGTPAKSVVVADAVAFVFVGVP